MSVAILFNRVPIGDATVDDLVDSVWRGHEPLAIKMKESVSKIDRKRKKIQRKLTTAGVETLKDPGLSLKFFCQHVFCPIQCDDLVNYFPISTLSTFPVA